MASDYIPKDQIHEILGKIKEYSDGRTTPLVQELYRLGYTYEQVGEILGVSKQAVMKKYPKQEVL